MILAFLKVFSAYFIMSLIIGSLVSLIVLLGTFCYKYIVYGRIKELYGKERDWCKTTIAGGVAVYCNYVHVSFESLLKFYSISPEKYEIEYSDNYDGIRYLTRVTSQHLPDSLYPVHKDIYYFIMDTFSDFLKYQKFCKNIEKQRTQEERRKEEQQDLEQSDFALGEYVELVKADIAENEKQLNKKIQDLKDEIEKQKQMLRE